MQQFLRQECIAVQSTSDLRRFVGSKATKRGGNGINVVQSSRSPNYINLNSSA